MREGQKLQIFVFKFIIMSS